MFACLKSSGDRFDGFPFVLLRNSHFSKNLSWAHPRSRWNRLSQQRTLTLSRKNQFESAMRNRLRRRSVN